MLNLTSEKIVLIAESGETTTIPASGYVARVEAKREVSREDRSDYCAKCRESGHHPHADMCDIEVLCIDCGDCEMGNGKCGCLYESLIVPIIEETPTEIVVDSALDAYVQQLPLALLKPATDSSELLLTTREVAEAAHALGHPLWRRMVWAPSEAIEFARHPEQDAGGLIRQVVGYCWLRRVPQGG